MSTKKIARSRSARNRNPLSRDSAPQFVADAVERGLRKHITEQAKRSEAALAEAAAEGDREALKSIRGLTDCTRQGILNFFARAAQELSDNEQLHSDARLLFEALNGLEAIDGELDSAGVPDLEDLKGSPAVQS